MLDKARYPGFYRLSVTERLEALRDKGRLSANDLLALRDGSHQLSTEVADKMIENVIGAMSLPMGLGLNFVINDKPYVIPLVVEEPSIVAALSAAGKVFADAGGVRTSLEESYLIGQVQVVGTEDLTLAKKAVLAHRSELLALANEQHPRLCQRGGGAVDLEVHLFPASPRNRPMLVCHLLVDTRDAMGANLVNTMCESIAGRLAQITGGEVFLRILSNLTDRSVVRAEVKVPVELLAGKGFSGEEVRDGMVLAGELAAIDPYRATTSNKGIMNGIDPLAVATGNDWRAIEAAAHAYAARSGRYSSLTTWSAAEDGSLAGSIEIPIKVGTQGASLRANDSACLNLRLLGTESAAELAQVMGAVGLAQNFSAVRALATTGIQKGHMALHARSAAVTAETPPELFDRVVARLVEEDNIKVSRARELVQEMQKAPPHPRKAPAATEGPRVEVRSHGKVILLGEHAVVYGRPALALPILNAIRAEASGAKEGILIEVPEWQMRTDLSRDSTIWWAALRDIFGQLGIADKPLHISVHPSIPPAMGLGGSAAMAVAIIRAAAAFHDLQLDDSEVNDLAFQCEKVMHGNPSGVDNTIAAYGRSLVFQRGENPRTRDLVFSRPLHLVTAMSDQASLTVDMVSRVRERWTASRALYEQLFDNFGQVANDGMDALQKGDLPRLGELMNICHGLLAAIQVSNPELDRMVQLARDEGALGAKLTGAGGGGSVVALCGEDPGRVLNAFREAGYRALEVNVQAGAGDG